MGGRPSSGSLPLLGFAPAAALENLGDPSFCSDHGVRHPYIAGSMANGISSVELVTAMAGAGCLGFFGSAGLTPAVVEEAIDRLAGEAGEGTYGFNFIHSPSEPGLEETLVDLYIRKGVRLVEASAFMDLTPAIVRYRLHGIRRGTGGEVIAPNRIIAKVSRVEVAGKFLAPAPERMLTQLVSDGRITAEQAELAAEIPVAQDLSVEADSGGHTDNRPLVSLLPTMISLRDRLQAKHGFRRSLRVGAAGGIATPAAAAAAFSMGAAYIVTGSVNQSCEESGTADVIRRMLSETGQADTAMAPAADMFELGVKVQVLKRGTMFAMRAQKLYDLYRSTPNLDAIPAAERRLLERDFFKQSLEAAWSDTRAFFEERDRSQIVRAEKDGKHKMALLFRSYLGRASTWANAGVPERRMDYQIWCGPAMGAFNEWAKGSFLEKRRRAADVALNILFGCAVQLRINSLRFQGVSLPAEARRLRPLEPARLEEYLK